MSDKPFRPMFAGKVEDVGQLRFQLFGSPKLDGIRCVIFGGVAYSRTMKPIPNAFVQAWASAHRGTLEACDGELIVGPPNLQTTYNTTVSAIMSEDGEPDFTYHWFDRAHMGVEYHQRMVTNWTCLPPRLVMVESEYLADANQLAEYEARVLAVGYEGVMLRDINGTYKQGRSTFREHKLLKLKRYEDAEAEILGFEEEMANGNEAFISELGLTKRSTHQANKTGKGTLGALIVRGLSAYEGVTFNVGTGFNAAQRAAMWAERETLLGRIITYKHFPIGAKDAPRHPVFKGFRDARDMGAPA